MCAPVHPQNLILHLPSQGCGGQTGAGDLLREGSLVWEAVGQVLKRRGGLDRYNEILQSVWLSGNLFSYSRGRKPVIKVPGGLVSSELCSLGFKWSPSCVFPEPVACVSICVCLSVFRSSF